MRALVGCLVALAIAAGGCDGSDETDTGARSTEPTETRTEQQPTESTRTSDTTEPETETTEPETETTERTPEEESGGAGDEESARSLALFTARGGRITPRVVRVPPFIAIRVELRSTDGRRYGLRFGTTRLVVKGGLSSVSTTLDGLRAGEAVTGEPVAAGNRVRIEATAEPGP